jgi:hypothetical protein
VLLENDAEGVAELLSDVDSEGEPLELGEAVPVVVLL